MMHIDLTEKEFTKKISYMSSKEVTNYLMCEGLSLKADKKDFSDVPTGIYRRVGGSDLIRKNFSGSTSDDFTWVDQRNEGEKREKIDWTLTYGGGDWWVQVLDNYNDPVMKGYRFRVDYNGERLS